jgi:hypothetical protein
MPVVWFETKAGKKMICDADTHEMRVFLADGKAVVGKTWVPHWSTCPNAGEFKKKRA